MTDFEKLYQEKKHTIPEILSTIRSGDVIFTTNNYSEPGEILLPPPRNRPQCGKRKDLEGPQRSLPLYGGPQYEGPH